MQYPIQLQFKVFALATQISITDASNQPIFYVRQKMFKFKEHIQIFRDSTMKTLLFEIRANKVIDFSANYLFTSADGMDWGAVRRRGMKSLWQAHYEIIQDEQIDMVLSEDNPWKKLLEGLLGEIPIVGLFAIYLLNPTYTVKRPDGEPLLKIIKKASFLERGFEIQKVNELPPDDELRSLLSLIMVSLLERKRG